MSSKYDIEGAKEALQSAGMTNPGATFQVYAYGDDLFDALGEVLQATGWLVGPGIYYDPFPSVKISTGDGFMVVRRDKDGKLSIDNGDETARLHGDAFQKFQDSPEGTDALHVLVREIIRITREWAAR